MFREGSKVCYVGDDVRRVPVGAVGVVLSSGGDASHVKWLTGAQTGGIDLVDDLDLVPQKSRTSTVRSDSRDSLDAPLVATAVRAVFDLDGAEGLLAALDQEGHLSSLRDVTERALQSIAVQVRQEPALLEAMGHLDAEEQGRVLTAASRLLVAEVLGDDTDG